MVFSYGYEQIESAIMKNTVKLLDVSMTMQLRWYNAGRIAQWNTSRASLEATGCHHWLSARIASPRRPPWLMI